MNLVANKNDDDSIRAHAEGNNRLLTEFDSLGDGMWDWNVASGEVFYSDRWVQSLGYDRDEIVPHLSFVDGIIHPGDKERLANAGAAHLDGHTNYFEYEYRMRKKSGDYRWTLGRCRVLKRNHEGKALRILGANFDITNTKHAELALAEKEERSRTIVETAACVILCLDSDFRILEWNQAAEKIYGWTRGEVRGKNYVEWFIPKEARERVTNEIQHVLAGGDAINFENPVIARDGTERLILWNSTGLLNDDGKTWGVVGIGQDITEQRNAERQREIAHREMQVMVERFDALRELLDVCSVCRKIRDGDGNWLSFDEYMLVSMDVEMSHGFCPACYDRVKQD
jgi:PAS domain S-box-containing protein